jgi:beta-fructofuranosidase
VPGDSALGPFDTSRAVPLTGEELYSGRLIRNRAGQWVMLAFRNVGAGGFVGEISDPIPVAWATDGSGLVAGRLAARPGQSAAAAG